MCCCLCFAGRSCKRIEFGLCRRDLPAVDRKAEGRDIGAHAATFAEQNGRQPNTLINRRPSRISSVESNPRLLILILLVGGPARGDITGPYIRARAHERVAQASPLCRYEMSWGCMERFLEPSADHAATLDVEASRSRAWRQSFAASMLIRMLAPIGITRGPLPSPRNLK
jgi:hypothetical protein